MVDGTRAAPKGLAGGGRVHSLERAIFRAKTLAFGPRLT
jgi:hypothetical protein